MRHSHVPPEKEKYLKLASLTKIFNIFLYIGIGLLSLMLSLNVGIGRERQILLVCRGNTCRSTMAFAVFSAKLSVSGDKGGEWKGYSWKLSSAGTRVDIPGRPANPNSLLALKTMGFDSTVLDKHESRLLTRKDFLRFALCSLHG